MQHEQFREVLNVLYEFANEVNILNGNPKLSNQVSSISEVFIASHISP